MALVCVLFFFSLIEIMAKFLCAPRYGEVKGRSSSRALLRPSFSSPFCDIEFYTHHLSNSSQLSAIATRFLFDLSLSPFPLLQPQHVIILTSFFPPLPTSFSTADYVCISLLARVSLFSFPPHSEITLFLAPRIA